MKNLFARMPVWTRFQGNVILPTARIIFLVAACGCLAVAVIGLTVAAGYQMKLMAPPGEVPVPPAYSAPPPAIDLATVEARLDPPRNIRLGFARAAFDRPLTAQDVLGRLVADSANLLAPPQGSFTIVGGKDAGLVQISQATIVPTQPLLKRFNDGFEAGGERSPISIEIEVVARDIYDLTSTTTPIAFTLSYAAPEPAAAPPPAAPEPAPAQLTDLQRLARDIALIVDPERTPKYFDTYAIALQLPERCGAGGNAAFIRNYETAFARTRTKLTPLSVGAFFAGVCDGWRRVIAAQAEANVAAEAARREAFAHNQAARVQAAAEQVGAWAGRNLALLIAGGALGAFLVVALFLAFLAIENHSKAVRETIQLLVNARGDSGGPGAGPAPVSQGTAS